MLIFNCSSWLVPFLSYLFTPKLRVAETFLGPHMSLPLVVMDLEIYKNYFLAAFRNIETGKTALIEMYEGRPLDTQRILRILRNHTIVTFNGINFDVPILCLSLKQGTTNAELKQACDAIILQNLKPWDMERQFGIPKLPWLNHIDLIEVAPGMASLKIYGGRLHSKRMQDLPIAPNDLISPADRIKLSSYCANDLETTIDLYKKLKAQVDLRIAMTAEYGIDLRSKSDAQIAEAVIKSQVERLKGNPVFRPETINDYEFVYKKPNFIKFKTESLNNTLSLVVDSEFTLGTSGNVLMPKSLESAKIKIGSSVYRMGIGGLHSSEKTNSHRSDAKYVLKDKDVTSYYPSIIMNQKLFPSHLGSNFLTVYKSILDRRVAAKRSGDKVTNEALKIVLNGSFGKFGSKWSILYSPDLLIQTTVTGQLALLMLIESLELAGFKVVSANTDGVVIKCERTREADMESIVAAWEKTTDFTTEEAIYEALYSRDVNNYIALKHGGGVKLKGAYALPGLQKNPSNQICVDAVVNYLTKGIPVDETIEWSTDIRKFVTIRQVKGGGMKEGIYLGKAVRWYYAKGEQGFIEYMSNGNKVAKSDGAKPLMVLPDLLPNDIDYDWYNREATEILHDIGALL